MAFKILREENPKLITLDELKTFSEKHSSSSPLRPLVGSEIKVKFTNKLAHGTFTPYEKDGQINDDQKFVEIETDKGWIALNCFKSKQVLDFKTLNAEMLVNGGVGSFTDDPFTIFNKINKNGANAVYIVSALSYVGKTDTGRLYPATSYVLKLK